MTVAALQSELLDTLLARRARHGDLDRLGPAFQRGAAALVRSPWLLNTSTDRAWQETALPLFPSFVGAVTVPGSWAGAPAVIASPADAGGPP